MSKHKWSPLLIRARLAERGYTLTELARSNGLHPRACIMGIRGRHVAAARVISKALNVPLVEIWPDMYRADGSRIDRRSTPRTDLLQRAA